MNNRRVGLSTGCFSGMRIPDCLDFIRAGGFNLIEVCSLPSHLNYHDEKLVDEVSSRLRDLGMEAFSLHAPFADSIDITSLNETVRRRSVEEVMAAARAAAALSARCLVIHPGPEHAGPGSPDEHRRRLDRAALSLSEITTRCHESGLLCVLENKLPHLLFGNIPDMLRILESMSASPAGVCLDTGHAYLAGNLEEAVNSLAGRIRMIHASDNNGRFDDHLPPGRGAIPWERVSHRLAAAGFTGEIILEIAGRGEPEHVINQAREAARFLESLTGFTADKAA